MPEHAPDNPRRDFLRKTLTLIPVVTVASTGLGVGASQLLAAPNRISNRTYRPRRQRATINRRSSAPKSGRLYKLRYRASSRLMSLAPAHSKPAPPSSSTAR